MATANNINRHQLNALRKELMAKTVEKWDVLGCTFLLLFRVSASSAFGKADEVRNDYRFGTFQGRRAYLSSLEEIGLYKKILEKFFKPLTADELKKFEVLVAKKEGYNECYPVTIEASAQVTAGAGSGSAVAAKMLALSFVASSHRGAGAGSSAPVASSVVSHESVAAAAPQLKA